MYAIATPALALGYRHNLACRDGYSVSYVRLPRLMEKPGLTHGNGCLVKLMAGNAKTD